MAAHKLTASEELPNLVWHRAGTPRHSLGYRVSHRAVSVVAMVLVAALTFVGTAAAAVWSDMSGTVKAQGVKSIVQDGKEDTENTLIDPYANEPIDILLIGQDTREGSDNTAVGGAADDTQGLHNSDTTMVMQIAADRSYINLVSIPRDSMVDVPSCTTSNGEIAAQYYVRFNSIFANAYAQGGDLASAASCTLSAVNSLTGMSIKNFMVVDFGGLVKMVDAIGGVDICVPVDTQDDTTQLDLKRGIHHLDGTQATQYARMRKGTGTDGSDIMRTTRQQYLIKRLVKTALSKNYFTQTSQLYQLAKAAIQSVQMSESLADVAALAGLAMSLKDFDTSHLYSQTVPIEADPLNPQATVVWASTANDVWAKLRDRKPLVESTTQSSGSSDGSSDTSSNGSDASGTDSNASTDGTTSTEGSSGSSDGTSSSSGTDDGSTYDAATNTITKADGTLIDADTNGIIDPETGAITDPNTGQFMGLANRYIEVTYCKGIS
ncbi:LCP family protein [Bifidobacterium biavatii]|uniref:Transcriptional regulator n=1 Tax=Bifidobacterium biavatii DSM 23969 TaxID=1437608 RepID=A0A086ZN40_9BIFI|nr:LCP family protein [Bifidobacterium biavatii]KFI47940.1 transcriptional regulator [Bifidobacterium biavatii DSM 23969]